MLSTLRVRFSGDASGARPFRPPCNACTRYERPYNIRYSEDAHLDGQEDLVSVARVLVEEPRDKLEVARAQVVRVKLAAVEEHLHSRREGVDASLDRLEALLVRDDTSAAPAVPRRSCSATGQLIRVRATHVIIMRPC